MLFDGRTIGAEITAVEWFDRNGESPKNLFLENVMVNPKKVCVYMRKSHDDDISIEAQRERLKSLAEREGYEIIRWWEEGASKKACAYLRMSTGDDISIEVQRERLLSLAGREGCEIIQWYVDMSTGSEPAERTQWLKLLTDAPTAEWEVILCLNRTRFSRLDDGSVTRMLMEAGKKLHTAIEGPVDWDATACEIIDQMIDAEEGVTPPIVVDGAEQPMDSTTPDKGLMDTIRTEMHHTESAQRARRSLEGQLHAFQEGRRIFGTCPYGYACVVTDLNGNAHRLSRKENSAVPKGWTKTLALGDPEEIEVVRWVFHMFATQVWSIAGLARHLNDRAVPAPMGGQWVPGAVADMLANDTYVGDTRFGRRSTGRYVRLDGGKVVWVSQRRKEEQQEGLLRQNTHEAIIHRDLWDCVQAKLNKPDKTN